MQQLEHGRCARWRCRRCSPTRACLAPCWERYRSACCLRWGMPSARGSPPAPQDVPPPDLGCEEQHGPRTPVVVSQPNAYLCDSLFLHSRLRWGLRRRTTHLGRQAAARNHFHDVPYARSNSSVTYTGAQPSIPDSPSERQLTLLQRSPSAIKRTATTPTRICTRAGPQSSKGVAVGGGLRDGSPVLGAGVQSLVV